MVAYLTGPDLWPYRVATTIGLTLGVMSRGPQYDDPTDVAKGAAYAATIVYIWNRTRVLGAMGPYGLAYMGGAVGGTIIAGIFFGQQGVTDAARFYVGEGNYFSGDEHGSGYFNVPKNLGVIYDDWSSSYEEGSPSHTRKMAARERRAGYEANLAQLRSRDSGQSDYWTRYREAADKSRN